MAVVKKNRKSRKRVAKFSEGGGSNDHQMDERPLLERFLDTPEGREWAERNMRGPRARMAGRAHGDAIRAGIERARQRGYTYYQDDRLPGDTQNSRMGRPVRTTQSSSERNRRRGERFYDGGPVEQGERESRPFDPGPYRGPSQGPDHGRGRQMGVDGRGTPMTEEEFNARRDLLRRNRAVHERRQEILDEVRRRAEDEEYRRLAAALERGGLDDVTPEQLSRGLGHADSPRERREIADAINARNAEGRARLRELVMSRVGNARPRRRPDPNAPRANVGRPSGQHPELVQRRIDRGIHSDMDRWESEELERRAQAAQRTGGRRITMDGPRASNIDNEGNIVDQRRVQAVEPWDRHLAIPPAPIDVFRDRQRQIRLENEADRRRLLEEGYTLGWGPPIAPNEGEPQHYDDWLASQEAERRPVQGEYKRGGRVAKARRRRRR